MKRFGFILIPVLAIVMMSQFVPRLLAGGMSPMSMIMLSAVILGALLLLRPKKAAAKTPEAVAEEVLDDFCANAFQTDEALMAKFQSALKDIAGNMPKSAVSKLEKLAPLCSAAEDKYAVAMATALAFRRQNDPKNAVREYNKALILHPTGNLAYTIGDCHQRCGELSKARDSYEFAIELNPENPAYYSALGTACVGDGMYYDAIDYSQQALDLDPTLTQALATMAICYGILGDDANSSHYQALAVENGYKSEKITETIKALKKRR